MPFHDRGATCPGCNKKLEQAHPYLRHWFRSVKERHPNAHVAWSYRNKEEQDKCFELGSSDLRFPNSKHNKTDENGAPASEALDLFQLDDSTGVALWDVGFYARLNAENKKNGELIRWGGEFKRADNPHFEYREISKA